jgi:hypothetical protein
MKTGSTIGFCIKDIEIDAAICDETCNPECDPCNIFMFFHVDSPLARITIKTTATLQTTDRF